MALLSLIQQRYSVRAYRDQPVEEEKLKAVLEAARLAPSARNLQEWRFVIVRDAERRKRLMAAANQQPFLGQAPVIIACCATNTDYVMRCGQKAYAIDVSIATAYMTLQAVEEGLGTCWLGSFDEEPVRLFLGVPRAASVVAMLTLGYPKDRLPPKNRLGLEQIVAYEGWSFR